MFSECVYIYNRVSTKTHSGGHAHHGFQTIGLDVAGGNAGNEKPCLNPADTEGGLRRKAHRISSCNNFYKIIPIYLSEALAELSSKNLCKASSFVGKQEHFFETKMVRRRQN